MKIFICYLYIFLIFTSCAKINSEEIDLEGVFGFKWDTTLNEVKEELQKRNYSKITIEDRYRISVETNYYGLPAVFSLVFNVNSQTITSGHIDLKNLENLEKHDFYNIADRLLKILSKKYGEPQDYYLYVEKRHESIINWRAWRFKNNKAINLHTDYRTGIPDWRLSEGKEILDHRMGISFLNNR